ncbi:alpha/beta fold hydrolase [Actinophytocola oryzae]|uniref:TAP-like protein n=1 Tax=Actinophytocola oryzae TaxID=502181 RepID=A0A4R7VYP5_9PSEU|nr:alpha/beta fold hydrolase [Actinophytocola oryzae]TDV55152.1 TAP-like protein [Actinophytocola oryzae]
MTLRESLARQSVRKRMWAVVAVAVIGLAPLPLRAAVAGTQTHGSDSSVVWQPCPTYSDDAIRAQGVTDEQIPRYRALLARMECGVVGVPLDYGRPDGRLINVAITRFRALDQAHRLGSIAMNPGGPGAGGYLMPIKVTMFNDQSARLNERYDLIGFDPRGVGYSTKVDCAARGNPVPGVLTEAAAHDSYDMVVAAGQACVQADPGFVAQLTTVNAARDLDRVRAALGEQTLSFIGVSWGTWLGAVYRNTFPGRVGRMFLDSVVNPQDGSAVTEDEGATAAEREFARFAAWIAQHDDTYHLGATQADVQAAVLALVRDYQANPKQFTDLPPPVDGVMIANLAAQPLSTWPQVSAAFAALRDAQGPTAPPALQAIFGGHPGGSAPDAPEEMNPTMRRAAACNDDTSRLDFSTAWTRYQRRLAQNPVTGLRNMFPPECVGWPLPAQVVTLRPTGGSLVLSGHRYENITPYEWAARLHSKIGGSLFTVEDDEHGSVLKNADCAEELVAYFNTGRIDRGCDGVPTP